MKALWTVGIVTLLGCAANEERVQPAARPEAADPVTVLSEAEYREQYVAVKNELNVRCCEQAGLRYQVPEEFWPPFPAVGRAFDGAAAAACIAFIAQQTCELQKEQSVGGSYPCSDVYVLGTSAPGESCATPSDCAPDERGEPGKCAFFKDGGVCQSSAVAREGETCGLVERDHSVDCEPLLLCDDDSHVCVRPAKLDEACLTGPFWGDTCEPGAVCDRQGTKRCVKPNAVGEPCSELEDCENLACVKGLCREPLFVLPLCERT